MYGEHRVNRVLTFGSRQDASKTTTSHHESSSTSSAHPSPTKTNKSKPAGLKKPAKIGIAVGVPLGVVAIAGAIAAYIIGKRRGRKRRVDDPTAGANKLIKDPSDEINIPPTTPDVVELPTVRSQEFIGQIESSFTWWRPFARTKSTAKKGYAKPHDAPHSPQELPA